MKNKMDKINNINISIKEDNGVLHIYNFGMFIAKGNRDELIELMNELVADETNDEYSKSLLKQIIECLTLGINHLSTHYDE